jgi:hypothetical protein
VLQGPHLLQVQISTHYSVRVTTRIYLKARALSSTGHHGSACIGTRESTTDPTLSLQRQQCLQRICSARSFNRPMGTAPYCMCSVLFQYLHPLH